MDNEHLQDLFIYNALDKDVRVQAFGNWFTFKPNQVKRMRAEIGQFLDSNKGYLGLIGLSEKFEDPTYAITEEGKAELAEKKHEGINRKVNYLQGIVDNLQVGLRRDLDTKNIKADVSAFASNGELDAVDELLSYQRQQKDEAKLKAERARVGLARLKSSQTGRINSPAPAAPSEPTKE